MNNTPKFFQVISLLKQPQMLDGETATCIEVVEESKRPFSLLQKARITTPTRQFHVYIKQYRLREPGESHLAFIRARVENDYNTTCMLYNRFSGFSSLGVPRPIACFPELLTEVFEASPGEDFQHMIQCCAYGWRSPRRLKRLVDYCEQCGEWLKRFQQMFANDRCYSIPEMWQDVDHRLQQLVVNPRAMLSESLRQQVRRYFEHLDTRVTPLDLKMTAVHADFSPSNILVDPSGVTAVDFERFRQGSIYQDLTRFYHQLELLLIKPYFRPQVIRQLQRAFLRGYDENCDLRAPMFDAFRLRHTATHFLTMVKSSHSSLHRRWYNHRVCRHHRYLMQKIVLN